MDSNRISFPRNAATFIIVACAAVVGLGACAEDDPTGPDQTSSLCEINHFAAVTFKNNSRRSTYDVLLNGSRIGVIAAGASISRNVPADISHTVLFKYSNSNQNACSQSNNSFVQCSNRILSCSVDQ